MEKQIYRKKALFGLLIVFLVALVFSFAAADQTVDVTIHGKARYDWAEEVFKIVNKEREKEGRSKLTFSRDLTECAMQRAAECCLYYSHTRPDQTSCFTISEEYGYAAFCCGENIAIGYTSPAAVMKGWMNSPGHKANILASGTEHIGVGCFISDNCYAWVQLFSYEEDNKTAAKNGVVECNVRIRTKVSLLNPQKLTVRNMTVVKGEPVMLPMVTVLNTEWKYSRCKLVPYAKSVRGYGRKKIAVSENGMLSGIEAGTGKLKLYLYQGQDTPIAVAQVTVNVPLKILSQPKNIRVSKAGKRASVSFEVQGNGLKYRWFTKKPGDKKFVMRSDKEKYSVMVNDQNNGMEVYCEVQDKQGKKVRTETITIRIGK